MPDAVYAIEHPDHVFSLHYFPVEDGERTHCRDAATRRAMDREGRN